MRKRNVLIALGLSSALVVSQWAGVFATTNAGTKSDAKVSETKSASQMLKGRAYAKDQLIVTFKSNTSNKRIKGVISGSTGKCQAISKVDGHKLAKVTISGDDSMKEAIARYQSDGRVQSVQPNYKYTFTSDTGTDPYLNATSAKRYYQYQFDSTKAMAAWTELESGKHAVTKVAVLDTGVDPNHEDLQKNFVTDKAGTYISTINGQNVESTDDSGYHGTHVTGIIGATYNNGKGGSGIASGHNNDLVQVMTVGTSFDGESLYTFDVVSGIKYAVSKGATVINMSFGGAGRDRAMEKAIKDAYYNNNVVFVAAAGNDDSNVYSDPSDLKEVISVNASNSANKPSYYSDYGMPKDITAPGSDITSTLPGDSYGRLSGTSMASPVVAGIVALVRDANPALTPVQIYNIICASTSQADFDENETAYGFIDAQAAVKAAKEASASIGVTSLTMKEIGVNVYTGDDVGLEALVRPATSLQPISWSSSDSSVAKVDNNGNVTGVAKGTAVITAYAGGKSVSCAVRVKQSVDPTAITIKGKPDSDELYLGEDDTLTADFTPSNVTVGEVYWTSSDNSIVSVHEGGVITGVGYGTATITALNYNGKVSDSFKITVKKKTRTVKFTASTSKLKVGKTYNFSAKLYAKDGSQDVAHNKITWKSSRSRIASVDSNGKVKAKRAGKVYIIAYDGSGIKKAMKRITVVK